MIKYQAIIVIVMIRGSNIVSIVNMIVIVDDKRIVIIY
jgi:hypothetical protein